MRYFFVCDKTQKPTTVYMPDEQAIHNYLQTLLIGFTFFSMDMLHALRVRTIMQAFLFCNNNERLRHAFNVHFDKVVKIANRSPFSSCFNYNS